MKANSSRLSSFLFSRTPGKGEYGFFVTRIILAYLWLDTVIPRWLALAIGQPEVNGLVKNLFGASLGLPMTYFVTSLETLAALSMLLGLFTRLGALWGVIEFLITGSFGLTLPPGTNCTVLQPPNICSHITGNFTLLRDFALWAGCVTLLLNGSLKLSIDGLLAKRMPK